MGKCSKEGVVYKIQCLECRRLGISAEYIGETSRSAYQRGKEHLDDIRLNNPDSPLMKHQKECHPKHKQPAFEMTIVKTHRKALERQIMEAVMIQKCQAQIVINNKTEWSKSKVFKVSAG